MQKPPTATDARPRPSATPGILLLGLPLVIASAVALGFLFHAVGIHQRKEPALSGLIAIIVGTRVLVVNQEKFRYPSRGLIIAAIIAAALVALILWLRLTNRIAAPE